MVCQSRRPTFPLVRCSASTDDGQANVRVVRGILLSWLLTLPALRSLPDSHYWLVRGS